jgi:hypothetical protein
LVFFGSQAWHGSKKFELDLGIDCTKYRGWACAARFVFALKPRQRRGLVVGCKADVLSISMPITSATAAASVTVDEQKLELIIVLPVLHEDADDFVAPLLEQIRGHRRVHAAAQTNNDSLSGFFLQSCMLRIILMWRQGLFAAFRMT